MLLHCFGRPAEEQATRRHKIFSEVEWITIFFFVGLFIVVYGVETAGLLQACWPTSWSRRPAAI